MTDLKIVPVPLKKEIVIPPSKSHTQRALLLAMRGTSKTTIFNPLTSPDIEAMCNALRAFGTKVDYFDDRIEVTPAFLPPQGLIDAGNSGQVLRFIASMAASHPSARPQKLLQELLRSGTSCCEITGDHSILTNRPIKPLFDALEQLGAQCKITSQSFTLQGPIQPGVCHLEGSDSQPVSALLMATAFLKGSTTIHVNNPGETPWIDLTLHWLKRLGAVVTHEAYKRYEVKGFLNYSGFSTTIPGDFSTAAFPLAAALISGSYLEILGLDPEDVQGDKALIPLLQSMGAQIEWNGKKLCVKPSTLQGKIIDVNPIIDALPILAVIGCFAKGKTTLTNALIARSKESDRIQAICTELKKMGAKIEERPDGLAVENSPLFGATLNSHKDHRIALSLFVAALNAQGPSTLCDIDCISKTFPNFQEALCELDTLRV